MKCILIITCMAVCIQLNCQYHTNTGEEASYEQYFSSRTDEGDNILHLAAREGHTQFIEVALDKLPTLILLVCHSNNNGENPRHVAAELGHVEISRLLVGVFRSHQHDVGDSTRSLSLLRITVVEEGWPTEPWKARDTCGETSLHKALKGGHEELAIFLLQEDPVLALYDNNEGESPLYLAADKGHGNFMEMTLASNWPYSTEGPNEATPLHAA